MEGAPASPNTSTFGECQFSAYHSLAHSLTHTFKRLDEDYIVFRGSEHEAASAHLSGRLLLCLSEPLNIKHLRLHLTGISRVW